MIYNNSNFESEPISFGREPPILVDRIRLTISTDVINAMYYKHRFQRLKLV